MEEVFNFDEFLSKGSEEPKRPISPIKERKVIETIIPEEIVEPVKQIQKIQEQIEEVEEFVEDEYDDQSSFIESDDNDDDFYKLYHDKNEEFVCDIAIEGSSPEDTFARIIIESEEWSLIFPGEIRNGKCIVPIKKLNILKEGLVGNIKLEVIAEGNLFTPWESDFKVKLSKKVTVSLNEQKKQPKKPIINNRVGVKVNVR